jgi:beta-lactam-binding protein with PASTA domain
VFVLLLLLLAVFGFTYGGSASVETGTTAAVPAERVPSVVGLASPYAGNRIRSAGLAPVSRWCAGGSFPGYAVARQRPAAGAVVPKGSPVRIFLVPAVGQGDRHPSCSRFVRARP